MLYYVKDVIMVNKNNKDRSFERIARRYWEKLVVDVIAPGPRGYSPSEGEMLSACNDIKSKYPECKCIIEYDKKRRRRQLQQGDKIKDITIVWTIASSTLGNVSIGFGGLRVNYVFFNINGIRPLVVRMAASCDLVQTVKNLEEFIEKLPDRIEDFEKQHLENEKKKKLVEITKRTIQASVEQVLSATPYTWDLLDKGKSFDLTVHMGAHNTVKVALDGRNFMKRMRMLQGTLKQVETFFDTLEIPVEILMKK